MREKLRKTTLRLKRPEPQEGAALRTLTFFIPRTYNTGTDGTRGPVELSKLVRTLREIRRSFPGYSISQTKGWYRDSDTGKEFSDNHFRFDIDIVTSPRVIENLKNWKVVLERRFDQQAIYMKLSERAVWL